MSEYSELQAAKEAAKQMTGGAKSLIGLLYKKSKTAVAEAYREVTEPLSLPEQARKAVDAKENRKVRNAKLQLVATRIAGGIVASTISGSVNIVLGAAKGIVGKLDKTTQALADEFVKEQDENEPPASEASGTHTQTEDED